MKFNQIKPELPKRKCIEMNNSPQEMIYSFDKFQITPTDFLCLGFHYLNSSLVVVLKTHVAEFS